MAVTTVVLTLALAIVEWSSIAAVFAEATTRRAPIVWESQTAVLPSTFAVFAEARVHVCRPAPCRSLAWRGTSAAFVVATGRRATAAMEYPTLCA